MESPPPQHRSSRAAGYRSPEKQPYSEPRKPALVGGGSGKGTVNTWRLTVGADVITYRSPSQLGGSALPIINVERSHNVKFVDCSFENADTAIRVRNSNDVSVINPTFRNVQQPFDIEARGRTTVTGSRIHRGPRATTAARTTLGYTPPKGPALPAKCPECGSIFPSKHYNFSVPEFLTKNNRDICPSCGSEDATLVEGLFDLTGGIVRALLAPDISLSMLQAIAIIGKKFEAGEIALPAAVTAISTISPSIASLIFKPLANTALIGWLAVFAPFAAGYIFDNSAIIREQTQELSRIANAAERQANAAERVEGMPTRPRESELEDDTALVETITKHCISLMKGDVFICEKSIDSRQSAQKKNVARKESSLQITNSGPTKTKKAFVTKKINSSKTAKKRRKELKTRREAFGGARLIRPDRRD